MQEQRRKLRTVAGHCLAGRLRLLNRLINTIYDRAMRPYGIKASQFNVLIAVGWSEVTTSKEACRLLQMDSSTFSRTLNRLKSSGWLESEPSGDGKIHNIRITREGLKKIEEIYPAWERAQADAEAILGSEATEAIRKAGTEQFMR